jgi:hypothetical protein
VSSGSRRPSSPPGVMPSWPRVELTMANKLLDAKIDRLETHRPLARPRLEHHPPEQNGPPGRVCATEHALGL